MGWILIILIGEFTKLCMLKKQKYFTPIRIIGMLSVFTGVLLRQISTGSTQFAIVGGLLMFGLIVYFIGWDRTKETKKTELELTGESE